MIMRAGMRAGSAEGADQGGDLDHAVREAPLVVVPGQDAAEALAHDGGLRQVEGRAVGIVVKVARHHGVEVNRDAVVSSDFNHDPHSSTFDLTQTAVMGKRFCRILSWYDNEWGFSNRMVEVAALVGALG